MMMMAMPLAPLQLHQHKLMKVQLLIMVLVRASEQRAKLSGCVLPPRRTAQLAHHYFEFGEVQHAVLIRIILSKQLLEVLKSASLNSIRSSNPAVDCSSNRLAYAGSTAVGAIACVGGNAIEGAR